MSTRCTSALLLFKFAALVGCLAAARAAEPLPKVGRWDRFEAVISNAKAYADPYRDVALNASLTRPDGSSVAFWGFYDGATTWRLRFMPDQIGTWRWTAQFSDGSPASQGSFECVASDLPGLIGVSAANPTWFGWKNGEPTILRGLHVGDRFFARNWDAGTGPGPRSAFLDWAQRQGYNTLSIASHYLNRNTKGRGEGWDTPKLWPLDAAEFRRMEQILDELARRRLVVFPFAGFFGRDSNFPREPAEQTRYLRYTIARLAPSWNLLWNASGPEPRLRNKEFLTIDEVNRLGAEIAQLDPFGHALTVHNQTGDDEFKDSPWLTFGTLQGPKTLDRRRLAAGLMKNHHPSKPLLAQETLWSGNTYHIRANKADYSDTDLRKHSYVIHFSGANFVFADNDGDSSTGFTGSLNPADAKPIRHEVLKKTWDQFAALPFGRTKPAPERVASADTHVLCLADPGRDYLCYFESPGTAQVDLGDGVYAVEWISAQNPGDRRRGDPVSQRAKLASPRDGDDWILHLRKQ